MFSVLARDRLEFHYAKNTPCTADEKEYVEKLFGIVCDMDTNGDAAGNITRWQLLNLVIPRCKRKIKSRLEKIRKRLRDISDAASSVGVFANPATPYSAITASAGSVDSETWLRDAIRESVFPASRTLQRFLQGCRVRKLGDFYAAALTLISHAAQFPNGHLRHLHIVEPQSAVPRTLHLSDDFAGTVNTWARHTGKPEVSFDGLRMAFQDMDKVKTGPSGTQSVAVTVHCECSLLLSMIAILPFAAPALLEIGVSKSSCFMCRQCVMSAQKHYRQLTILISSCHGKYVAGWSLPESAPRPLKEAMRKLVRDNMDEVLQRAARKPKSDSIPGAVTS
ncbi:hypothetical protein Q9L58_010227, partial [Maublancomyces gigas]